MCFFLAYFTLCNRLRTWKQPSAILDILGRRDGERKKGMSLCSLGFTLTSVWMICGQLEPFSDPSSVLLCTPALPHLAERLMVSCIYRLFLQFSSVQMLSRVRLFVTQWNAAARPPCPSPTPRVYSNSCPLSQWCHLTILSSVVHFSSCLQSFPASGFFQMSQLWLTGVYMHTVTFQNTPHCTADTRVMNLAGPALVSGNFPSSSSNCTIRSVPSATKGITRGALEDRKGGLTLTTWCVCVCERRLIRPALLTLGVWWEAKPNTRKQNLASAILWTANCDHL